MAQRIQFRRDTAANWTSVNPILAQGELGLETDTMTYKIGTGLANWNTLPYGGVAGAGVAPGGTVGQYLKKNSGVNYDTSWDTFVLAAITDVTVTAAQLNAIQSGLDYPGHFHASDRARANHTGTQSAATITGLATVATSGAYADLTGTPSALPPSGAAGGDLTGTYPNPTLSAAIQSFLLARANHTGTQSAATITGLATVATSGLKADIGLGNVDNTSDANKPVSTAQATAISLKANKAGDTFTGAVVVEGDNTTTGYINLKQQTTGAPTPAGGVNISADTNERFTISGQSGFDAAIADAALTQDRVYTLPDASGTLMMDPMTTAGDLISRNGSNVTSRLGVGASYTLLRSVSGVPTWSDENLLQDFGDGSDGNLTVSGALTLSQIPYYNILTINAGAVINPDGYPIYCKVLDLTNAPAGAIIKTGNPGANSANNTGGAGGTAYTARVLATNVAGGAGAAGQSNNGVQGGAGGAIAVGNGGGGGASGASGAGGTGLAANAIAGGAVTTTTRFSRFEYQFIRGIVQVSGGAGGRGGNSGGGDGANTSRGGGGGGAGGAVIVIYAGEVITGPSTPAGVIVAKGGLGGSQTSAPASGSCGGAGGGGGGGGGYIYLTYVKKTGTAVSGLLDASGGNGGNGSNGLGTGIGGNGGQGGTGGNIQLYNAAAETGTLTVGAAGANGTAGVGLTGGTGGNGGSCVVAL
jgi:hypothetical protein